VQRLVEEKVPQGIEYDWARLDKEELKRAFLDNLFYRRGKYPRLATQHDYYMALAYLVRDHMLHRWISTASAYTEQGSRTVAYLSAEFLMGPHLGNNLINLGILEPVRDAIDELGLDLENLMLQEEEPGLGNGGLGRLAACFLDSLATLEIPALGYGIRYEFGIFRQAIVDGKQVEKTDKWLRNSNPWELARPEWALEVKLGGHTEHYVDEQNRHRVHWVPDQVIRGVPYDTPILGYQINTANTLRLWQAEAPESFDFELFNRGNYYGAVEQKIASENLSKVLYPNDELQEGKELRLKQQFFFVSCSLQDMLRIMKVQNIPLGQFSEKFTIQLNDTHPAIAVVELMRLLIDENGMDWDEAWEITTSSIAYTNHTLLPEALECWPVWLFRKHLPRHLEFIYELNARFLDQVRLRFFNDPQRIARMSLIDEHGVRSIRMAHLACIGSYSINGVAELHSELVKDRLLKDFYELWPHKFNNKTNGVTPRRWMVLSNPGLTSLISESIGTGWITELDELQQIEAFADDSAFTERWRMIKRENKRNFARFARYLTGTVLDPDSLFDVQVKRIHEYKRQHLNILHIIGLYMRLKENPGLELMPRTFIFGGKAAPGYHMAKLIIRLINAVGDMLNRDPVIRDRLQVFFLPNFNVTNGQHVYPAADLSEQISTAGKEASGTGNMKFAMNGAVTIGTLDGANIEIRQEVGAENFFLFGLDVSEVHRLQTRGYHPGDHCAPGTELHEIFKLIASGFFSRGDTALYRPLLDNLLHHDPYLVMADYADYARCQSGVNRNCLDSKRWTRMSIFNTARSGKFSSDRSIREYCDDIWKVHPVPVRLISHDDVKPDIL